MPYNNVTARMFSTEDSKAAVEINHEVEDYNKWESTALRPVAIAKHSNLRASPRKMNELCRMVRG